MEKRYEICKIVIAFVILMRLFLLKFNISFNIQIWEFFLQVMQFRLKKNRNRPSPGKSSSVIFWRRKVILLNLKTGIDETSCPKSSSGEKRFRLVVSRNCPGPRGLKNRGKWLRLDKVISEILKGAQAWPNRVRIFLHKSNLYGLVTWEQGPKKIFGLFWALYYPLIPEIFA